MKKLYVCQVIDSISETVVSTFTAPTPAYFCRQMEAFMKDCEKKNIPFADFEGFVVAAVDVCETFNEAADFLRTNEVVRYSGCDYLDDSDFESKKVVKEVVDEVQSNV